MRRRWMHFIAVLLFFAGVEQAAVAADHPPARILQVTRAAASGTHHQTERLRMPKFLIEELGGDGDAYRVIWEPVAGSLPAGVAVTFEYTQQRAAGVRTLSLEYPFEVRGRRTATFTIADQAYQLGGPVAQWRARVTHDGAVLAEQTSSGWSEPR